MTANGFQRPVSHRSYCSGSVFSRRRLPPREPRPHAVGADMLTSGGIPRGGRRDAHEPSPSLPVAPPTSATSRHGASFPTSQPHANPAAVAPLSCSSYAAAELIPSAAMLPNPCGGPAPSIRLLSRRGLQPWPLLIGTVLSLLPM